MTSNIMNVKKTQPKTQLFNNYYKLDLSTRVVLIQRGLFLNH